MRGGDLSNEVAAGIGIRFERVIRTEDEGKLNRAAKDYLLKIGNVDVNSYIITTNNYRKAAAFCHKWGVPYTRIIEAAGPLEIPDIVRENDLVTYWDLDKFVLDNINSRGHGKVDARLWTSVQL